MKRKEGGGKENKNSKRKEWEKEGDIDKNRNIMKKHMNIYVDEIEIEWDRWKTGSQWKMEKEK